MKRTNESREGEREDAKKRDAVAAAHLRMNCNNFCLRERLETETERQSSKVKRQDKAEKGTAFGLHRWTDETKTDRQEKR